MALIRALAIHLPTEYRSIELIDRIIKTLNNLEECMKIYNVTPWTLRMIFPAVSDLKNLRMYLNELFSVTNKNVLTSISFEGSLFEIYQLTKMLQEYEKLYSAIRCDNDDCIHKAVTSLYVKPVNNIDLNIYSRIAVVFGSWVETPYFPATCNISNTLGLSASLRYVDLVDKALFTESQQELFRFIQEVQSKLEFISKCCDIPFLGIDLSLSPWREESVGMIIEKLIINKVGSPGTVNAIYSLNKLIIGLIKKLSVKNIGFNEVMLPIAEDNILNERVKEGFLRLRDLVNYSILCTVGLDMVATPLMLDIYRLSVDMLTVYKVKKRTVAMRIIPVDQEPGTAVKLENFGITYVVYP